MEKKKSKMRRFLNVLLYILVMPLVFPIALPYLFFKNIIRIAKGK